MIDYYPLSDIKFNGHCLINNNNTALGAMNLYISYTLDWWSRDLNTDFTLGNCLFGSVKLTKNVVPDKYKYSSWQYLAVAWKKNVIIFGVDMSSSVHIDHKGKVTLILGEEPTQGLDDATLTAEAKYLINVTQIEHLC